MTLDFLTPTLLTGRHEGRTTPDGVWLTTISREFTWDGFVHEVHIYSDGIVEIIFDGYLCKSYHHGTLPAVEPLVAPVPADFTFESLEPV